MKKDSLIGIIITRKLRKKLGLSKKKKKKKKKKKIWTMNGYRSYGMR